MESDQPIVRILNWLRSTKNASKNILAQANERESVLNDLLLSWFTDISSREAILSEAFLGTNLLSIIDVSGSNRVFVARLINQLVQYGEVEPGKQAIIQLLESLESRAGEDSQRVIREIITQYEQENLVTEKASVQQKFSDENLQRTRKLFLAYRSIDAAKVDKVATDLSQFKFDDGTQRYTMWQDKHNLLPGTNWWDAILDAIVNCDVLVFFVSESSLKSQFCLAEVEYARKRNRPIIPVVLDGEFFLNAQTGKYDLPQETWRLVPDWLGESQFLFYNDTGFSSQFHQAAKVFKRNLFRDLPAPRPTPPGNITANRSHHALYDEACDLAERLAFADAERRFNILVTRNDPDYAGVAAEWLEIIRQYAELIEIDEGHSARFLFNKYWAQYTTLFPKEFLGEIFDPKGFAQRTASPNGILFALLLANEIEIKSRQGKSLAKLSGHTNRVTDVVWSASGQRLLSASADNTVRIWDTGDWLALNVLTGHTAPVNGVLEMQDGRLLSWSDDRTLRIWSQNGEPLAVLEGHTNAVTNAEVLEDGRIKSTDSRGVELIWSSDGQIQPQVIRIKNDSKKLQLPEKFFFFSYAGTEGINLAERIYRNLKSRSIPVWMTHEDREELGYFGSDWLELVIKQSTGIVFVVSKSTPNSSSATYDIPFAQKHNIPIIVVRADASQIPTALNTFPAIEFNHTRDFKKSFEQLIAEIQEIIG